MLLILPSSILRRFASPAQSNHSMHVGNPSGWFDHVVDCIIYLGSHLEEEDVRETAKKVIHGRQRKCVARNSKRRGTGPMGIPKYGPPVNPCLLSSSSKRKKIERGVATGILGLV